MRFWPAFILLITLASCTTEPSMDRRPSGSMSMEKPHDLKKDPNRAKEQIVKSPHGYVISGPKARFGGFIGDCSSDENFPYYWQCQAENEGNDFH